MTEMEEQHARYRKAQGYVDKRTFAADVERMEAHLAIHGEPFERDDVVTALLFVYTDKIRHRYWNADGQDDGTAKGRVRRLLSRMQVALQENGDDEAEDVLCDLVLDKVWDNLRP